MLAAAIDDGLLKAVIGVGLNGVQDALGLQRNLAARPVAWQNRDAMVTHDVAHRTRLHERNPRS